MAQVRFMLDAIKQLREETGAPIGEIRKALEMSQGDTAKAKSMLRQHGGAVLEKRSDRQLKEGGVEAYLHSNYKIGALLELYSETDFVSRNPAFRELAHNLAMQVAAMNPVYVSLEDVPEEIKSSLMVEFSSDPSLVGKPENIRNEIISGKVSKVLKEQSLLEQFYVKDQAKSVGDVIKEAVAKFGENIRVGKFIRYQL